MKYRSVKTETGKLEKENLELCKEIVTLRDGKKCCIPFCTSYGTLQLDHCFTRDALILHFEPRNLNWLCRQCHTHKSFRKGGWADHLVKEITRKRDPVWYDEAIMKSRQVCREFHTVTYQKQINIKLKEERAVLLEKGESK